MKLKLDSKKIFEFMLQWGILILAVSITFSISLMNTAFVMLFIALLIQVFKNKTKFIKTGLERPIAVFNGLFLLSAILSPNPAKSIKDVTDNYWYILHIYVVINLFGTKEIDKFARILAWSAFAIGIYTVLQSLIGLNFNLQFRMDHCTPQI